MNCYFCGLNLIPEQYNPTSMRCPDTKCQGYGFAINEPMPTPQTPTPETDAAEMFLNDDPHWPNSRMGGTRVVKSELARKLERERDEARSSKHCPDCCCGHSWKALEIVEYTGKSIPEHITQLKAELTQLRKELLEWQTIGADETTQKEIVQLRKVCDEQLKTIRDCNDYEQDQRVILESFIKVCETIAEMDIPANDVHPNVLQEFCYKCKELAQKAVNYSTLAHVIAAKGK